MTSIPSAHSSAPPARVGVAGAGGWSTYNHIPALLAHPRAELAGLRDTNPERLTATTHNLIDVILGTAPNGSPAETGWRTVELLDAAYRSAARQGQAVWVNDLYSDEAAA